MWNEYNSFAVNLIGGFGTCFGKYD
jgi:hypothetical protein